MFETPSFVLHGFHQGMTYYADYTLSDKEKYIDNEVMLITGEDINFKLTILDNKTIPKVIVPSDNEKKESKEKEKKQKEEE